jgi:hypothetical protein
MAEWERITVKQGLTPEREWREAPLLMNPSFSPAVKELFGLFDGIYRDIEKAFTATCCSKTAGKRRQLIN